LRGFRDRLPSSLTVLRSFDVTEASLCSGTEYN
jgi:hypothetical protein